MLEMQKIVIKSRSLLQLLRLEIIWSTCKKLTSLAKKHFTMPVLAALV